jgi:hypothetical protein
LVLTRRSLLGAFGARALAGARSSSDEAFLEDLSHRAFLMLWEQSDRTTGLTMDRARNDGSREPRAANMATIAATGFALTGLCIAAERRWISRDEAAERVRITLRSFDRRIENHHGWFYHFLDGTMGDRFRNTELSSIDTALLLAGVLTARQFFDGDSEIPRLARTIYERVDFQWMLNGDGLLLSHGWKPESGFLRFRWNRMDEAVLLYVLAIGSPTHPISPASWYAWERPVMTYDGITFVSGAPLFTHQYPQAWLDLRGLRDGPPSNLNYFENSVQATRANRAFCIDLAKDFPKSYSKDVWGISASDGEKGYHAWGNPPQRDDIDGTLVPCAPGGSLMFVPEECLSDLKEMKRRYGERVWGRYGFADAFNPTTGWVNPDVLGIDLGITLLSAENLRTGFVWKQFMRNPEIRKALDLAGFRRQAPRPQ